MTSQGSAHGRFQRAVRRRHLHGAEIAARELGRLALPDALSYCLLLAELDPKRFDAAAVRWHGRFALEVGGVALAESQLMLAALAGLRDARDASVETLRVVSRLHRLDAIEAALRTPREP